MQRFGARQATVVSCKSEQYGRVKLSYIHEYEEQSFLKALEGAGFEVVTSEPGGGGEFLVCVARKKG